MTDFIVLALCTGALGAKDFLSGPNKTRFHDKMALVLNGLKLKEAIPDDWRRSADVRQNHVWPAGNVARSRVQIGGYEKQEDFFKKLRAFAEVVEVFYNAKWGAEIKIMAADFKVLAKIRKEGHAVYPIELLACAFEKLMHQFVLGARKQTTECLLTMEATRNDTKRPHMFTNLRVLMLSRRLDRSMAFQMPTSFVDVRSERSSFVKVWRSFYSKATMKMMTQGASAYDVPTTSKGARGSKPVGAGDSGSSSGDGGGGLTENADSVKAAAFAAAVAETAKALVAAQGGPG